MTSDRIEEATDQAPFAESPAGQSSATQEALAQSTPEDAASNANAVLWSKRLSWVILAAMTAVLLISIIHNPAPVKPGEEYFTVCGFKNLTGLPCPGCGLTHSFCEIGKGHLASAVRWNLLGIPLFLVIILVWVQALFILTDKIKLASALEQLAARLRPLRLFALAFVLYGLGRILYILIYEPSTRVSNPFSKLFKLMSS
jgi:hypothetical protein